jgi:O-methyltransferase
MHPHENAAMFQMEGPVIHPAIRRAIRRVRQLVKRAGHWRLRWVLTNFDAQHQGVEYAYETITRHRAYAPWANDREFFSVYSKARHHTLVAVERCYELWELIHNLRSFRGAVIEVGVWRGGTGAILASALARTRPTETIYLCDTFRGVPKAGCNDSLYRGGEHADTSVDHVSALLKSLPVSNAVLVEGVFPDRTGPQIPPGPISLCHIDVDVYESARDIVAWVEDRMPPGAILVFDDYGFSSCVGVTRIVNEIKKTGRWFAIYNLNGHAVLIKQPPSP